MTAPYVSYHGIILCDATKSIVDIDGVQESGGGRRVDSYSGIDRDSADVFEEGREATTYSAELHSATRADIEEAVAVINSGPVDAEFYPRESDRCVYAAYASASRPKTMQVAGPALHYYAEVEIVARDGKQYGDEQGIAFQRDVSLPKTSAALTNAGYYENTLDFLYASGYYDAALGYTTGLGITVGDYTLDLCDKMIAGDCFKLDRFGQVVHSYSTDFPSLYSVLQAEIGGSTFVDEGDTAGTMAPASWKVTNNARLMFPFYGPLPVQSPPLLEIDISWLTGAPEISVAYATDLSDIEAIDYTLEEGHNQIWIPECEGEDFVAFGLTTGSGASCTMASAYAEVKRYIAPDEMPVLEVNEDFTISVNDEDGSNHLLSALQAVYRDAY